MNAIAPTARHTEEIVDALTLVTSAWASSAAFMPMDEDRCVEIIVNAETRSWKVPSAVVLRQEDPESFRTNVTVLGYSGVILNQMTLDLPPAYAAPVVDAFIAQVTS